MVPSGAVHFLYLKTGMVTLPIWDFKIQERGRREREPEVKWHLKVSLRMTTSWMCRVVVDDGRDSKAFRVGDKT